MYWKKTRQNSQVNVVYFLKSTFSSLSVQHELKPGGGRRRKGREENLLSYPLTTSTFLYAFIYIQIINSLQNDDLNEFVIVIGKGLRLMEMENSDKFL